MPLLLESHNPFMVLKLHQTSVPTFTFCISLQGLYCFIESHSCLNQNKLREFCLARGITITAYNPLGSTSRPRQKPRNPAVSNDWRTKGVTKKYNRLWSNRIFSWETRSYLPKVFKQTLPEKFMIFDFSLSGEDVEYINIFDCNRSLCEFEFSLVLVTFVERKFGLRLPLNDQSAITRHVYLPISRTYLQKMIFAPWLLPFRGFISPWGNITRVQRWNCNEIGWLLTYHLFLLIHSLPLEGKTWIRLVIENPFVRFSCYFWTLKIHKYQFRWYWGCLWRRRGVGVFEGELVPCMISRCPMALSKIYYKHRWQVCHPHHQLLAVNTSRGAAF